MTLVIWNMIWMHFLLIFQSLSFNPFLLFYVITKSIIYIKIPGKHPNCFTYRLDPHNQLDCNRLNKWTMRSRLSSWNIVLYQCENDCNMQIVALYIRAKYRVLRKFGVTRHAKYRVSYCEIDCVKTIFIKNRLGIYWFNWSKWRIRMI